MPRPTAKEQHHRQLGRHRPVSCYFCRARKLRCSRQFPCTNCTARGVDCRLYAPGQGVSEFDSLATSAPETTQESQHEQPSEILDRLKRLEEVLLNSSATSPSSVQPTSQNTATATEPPILPPAEKRISSDFTGRNPPPVTDPEWLERQCVDQGSVCLFVPEPLTFKVCPLAQITKPHSYIFPPPTGPSHSSWGEPTKCIWLPQYAEAKSLLEKYLGDVTCVHHVVHTPTLRDQLDELYRSLNGNEQDCRNVKPEIVALLLAIFASTIHLQPVVSVDPQAIVLTTSTFEVLAHCRMVGSGSLEEIQAMIVILFVVSHLEGLSRRFWSLMSDATMVARALGLHRIDLKANEALQWMPPVDSIKAEMGRRIWWYLVATDWMFSRYAGPFDGLYTISPRHMCVREPLNANDEDLFDGMDLSTLGKPLSEPTSMSYILQRIRMAHICREIVDNTPWRASFSPTHQQIMEIDAKIEGFIQTLPDFYKLDEYNSTIGRSNDGKLRRYSSEIVIQRYILNSLLHAQRCKFHLHYLSRPSSRSNRDSPEYVLSREICLNAARLIIRTERELEHEKMAFAKYRLKFSGVLYCLFMAIMVLGLDLCAHKSTGGNSASSDRVDADRKAELVHACRILAEARNHCAIAANVLDSLLKVLKKHQVALPALDRPAVDIFNAQVAPRTSMVTAPNDGFSTASTAISGLSSADDVVGVDSNAIFNPPETAEAETLYFDELWQTFNSEMDFESLFYGGWFSELESQF